jgi:hypothetical protein
MLIKSSVGLEAFFFMKPHHKFQLPRVQTSPRPVRTIPQLFEGSIPFQLSLLHIL